MVKFRMVSVVKFDRKIENDHIISPGGYTMTFGSKKVEFDFEDYEGVIDEKTKDTLHIEQKNPDYNAFKELLSLTEDDLSKLSEITEFYVYTGENCDLEINPVELMELKIEALTEDGVKTYDYTAEIKHGKIKYCLCN